MPLPKLEKTVVILLIVVVFILGLIALIVWLSKLTPPKIPPGALPNAGKGIPDNWTPSGLSDRLFDQIDGANISLKENGELFREFATLPTDDMFAAVIEDYRLRHTKFGGDLGKDIEGEMPVGLVPDASYWKDIVLARMKQLQKY